jgi:RNA polymerase-binding transcription factor DksA
MSESNGTAKLLELERTRLNRIRSSLAEVAEDVERDPTGDPSAGGHVADAGSEMFERARDLSIISEIDAQLTDIDHAEARLSNGTYGTCEACGKAIGPERLAVRPATRFCIEDQIGVERETQTRGA